MSRPAPETVETEKTRVSCDGGALGHPLVWLQIDPEIGWVECGYCDKRFVLVRETAKA
ncbi:MAG: zinc-finger domain-containing protein [Pseudomonadota bacterium]